MIEKLKETYTETTRSKITQKINELVDAVNYHQKWLSEIQCHIDTQPAENSTISKMENVDPYAEQRKWIGKLCRFWDVATDKGTYGVLTDIKDDRYVCPNGIFMCNRIRYQHCEPVKPTDDIIYKGGDNE